MENLHCGACMVDFDDIKELNKHLDNCPAAEALLSLATIVGFGGDKIGHPISHFINSVHKNTNLIRRYAYAIADEMNSFERSKIHAELCEKLGLDYQKFRPFESEDIKEMPDRKEAENILWNALGESGLLIK